MHISFVYAPFFYNKTVIETLPDSTRPFLAQCGQAVD